MPQRVTKSCCSCFFLFRLQGSTRNSVTMLGAMQSPPHHGVIVDKPRQSIWVVDLELDSDISCLWKVSFESDDVILLSLILNRLPNVNWFCWAWLKSVLTLITNLSNLRPNLFLKFCTTWPFHTVFTPDVEVIEHFARDCQWRVHAQRVLMMFCSRTRPAQPISVHIHTLYCKFI